MIIIIIAQEIILLYKSIFYVGCLRKKVVCSIELFTPRSEQSASSKKRRTTSSSSFAPDQFSDNIDLEDLIDNLWCSWPLGQYLGYPWGPLATSKNLVTFMLPWEYFSTGWSGSKYDEGIHPSEKKWPHWQFTMPLTFGSVYPWCHSAIFTCMPQWVC